MTSPNIIYIRGNNSFLCEREKRGLVRIFREKYGGENISLCSLDKEKDFLQYKTDLCSPGLFPQKRMFLFSGGREKKTKTPGFEKILEEIEDSLSPDDFLLYMYIPPAEANLIKWLTKKANIREKNISWQAKDWEAYTTLSVPNIRATLSYYALAEKMREKNSNDRFLGHAIAHTLEALSLLEIAKIPITKELIAENASAYEGARIFDCIDALLQNNTRKALDGFHKMVRDASGGDILRLYGSLIGLLRQSLYVISFRDMGYTSTQISDLLPSLHPFVIKKNIGAAIKKESIAKLYKKLILSSIAYKSGKGMKKSELGRIFDIEVALLELQK